MMMKVIRFFLAGIALPVMLTMSVRADSAERVSNTLETFSEFASISLANVYNQTIALHAAAEDLYHEASAESKQAAVLAFKNVYQSYLQSEVYALAAMDSGAEIHRLIDAVDAESCDPSFSPVPFIEPVLADSETYPEITADDLYTFQEKSGKQVVGFRMIDALLNGPKTEAEASRIHAYLLASAELLSRNIRELQDLWSAVNDRTMENPGEDIARIGRILVELTNRNLGLVNNSACKDDAALSLILTENISGFYQLWIGQLNGQGASGLSRHGLNALTAELDPELADQINNSLKTLFHTARLLGDEKIRQDKDQYLANFSSRTRDEINRLLASQTALWTQFTTLFAP